MNGILEICCVCQRAVEYGVRVKNIEVNKVN